MSLFGDYPSEMRHPDEMSDDDLTAILADTFAGAAPPIGPELGRMLASGLTIAAYQAEPKAPSTPRRIPMPAFLRGATTKVSAAVFASALVLFGVGVAGALVGGGGAPASFVGADTTADHVQAENVDDGQVEAAAEETTTTVAPDPAATVAPSATPAPAGACADEAEVDHQDADTNADAEGDGEVGVQHENDCNDDANEPESAESDVKGKDKNEKDDGDKVEQKDQGDHEG
jgi:hypothetical protein